MSFINTNGMSIDRGRGSFALKNRNNSNVTLPSSSIKTLNLNDTLFSNSSSNGNNDELKRKIILLDRVKVSLESIIFNNYSWHQNYSSIMVMFCRHVLAIFEDGIKTGHPVASGGDSTINGHSDHNDNANKYVNGNENNVNVEEDDVRSIKASDVRTYSMASTSDATTNQVTSQLLWSLLRTIFNMDDEDADSFHVSESGDLVKEEESQACKDFHNAYQQIVKNLDESSSNDASSSKSKPYDMISKESLKKLNVETENSTGNQNSEVNMPFEWITISLRHYTLLSQLKFILNKEKHRALLNAYYAKGSFLLDDLAVEDFLIYIKAYEQRDYSLLNQAKLKKTLIIHRTSTNTNSICNETVARSRASSNKSIGQKLAECQASYDSSDSGRKHADTISSTSSSSQNQISNVKNSNAQQASSSSLMFDNDESCEQSQKYYQALPLKQQQKHLAVASNSELNEQVELNSLLERRINELNVKNIKASNHRRQQSFPNIQINLLKRNNLMNNLNARVDSMSIKSTSSTNIQMPVFELNNEVKEIDDLISNRSKEDFDKQKQAKEEEDTDIYDDEDDDDFDEELRSKTDEEAISRSLEDSIYDQTTVFDFLQAQQIHCERSVLDKENSHFIMADIALAAIEIVKTQSLVNYADIEEEQELSDKNRQTLATIVDDNKRESNEMSDDEEGIVMKISDRKLQVSKSIGIESSAGRRQILKSFDNSQTIDLSMGIEDSYSPSVGSSFPNIQSSSPSSQPIFFSGEEFISSSIDQPFSNEQQRLKKSKWLSTKSAVETTGLMSMDHSPDDALSLSESHYQPEPESEPEHEQEMEPAMPSKQITAENSNNSSERTSSMDEPTTSQEQSSKVVFRKQDSIGKDFEIMNTKQTVVPTSFQKSNSRTRRYSWEEHDRSNTAEHIATRLIEKVLANETSRRMKLNAKCAPIDLPTLRQFELFIQTIEFEEYLQTYYELVNSGKLKKIYQQLAQQQQQSGKTLNSRNSVSASTIFLSHLSLTGTETSKKSMANSSSSGKDTSSLNSKLFVKLFSKSSNNVSRISSPYQLVKSAALAAAAASLNQYTSEMNEKNDSFVIVDSTKRTSTRPVSFNKSAMIRQLSQTNMNDMKDLRSVGRGVSFDQSFMPSGSSPGTASSRSSSIFNNYKSLRIIGDDDWAPVREQLILNLPTKQKRADLMAQQRYRCANCGVQVKPDKMKTFNYCEYFSKYFCRCCHTNGISYIPAYIVLLSDYKQTYQVSNKAKTFLEKIFNEPLITLESLNPSLFDQPNSTFSKVKRLRLKLCNSKRYIYSCRFATEIRAELENNFDDFIIDDASVYSISSLFKFKKGNYYDLLKQMVSKIVEHIRNCPICSVQGFVCEICLRDNDILYPFDFERVEKCPNCLSCYHKTCFIKPEQCLRCKRKKTRKQSILASPSTSAVMQSK